MKRVRRFPPTALAQSGRGLLFVFFFVLTSLWLTCTDYCQEYSLAEHEESLRHSRHHGKSRAAVSCRNRIVFVSYDKCLRHLREIGFGSF